MGGTLLITRGLPASGKSTKALEWVNEDPENRARVNRDELRQTLYGVYHGLSYKQEQTISHAQRAAVKSLIEGGKSVIVDDTNLRLRYARAWADLAHELGVGFSVIEVETDVDECVLRDELRGVHGGRTVGEPVIRGMAVRFGGKREPVLPSLTAKKKSGFTPVPWTPNKSLTPVWIFDLDGTLAHNDGHRGWYNDEELKVGGDTPWAEVVAVADALLFRGDRLLFMSGRTERCREQTADWLAEHLDIAAPDKDRLFMRAIGDQRPDDVVKDELFEANIAGKYNVRGVFDDRRQVVAMWRAKGLPVFDVNKNGDF